MFQSIKRFINWLCDDEWLRGEQHHSHSSTSEAPRAPEGFVLPATRAELECDKIILDKLRVLKRSGLALPYEVWPEFITDTVVNYAMWCQDLPASENHHHTGKRGLLLHSLDVAIYAMRLRRNAILPPNTPPEEVIHREMVWVYGVFLCALLHDSGKMNDFEIELYRDGEEPEQWSLAVGAITRPYRCRYHKNRQYATHQYMGHTLLTHLLSSDAMLAITSDKALFHTMVEYLSGHKNPDNVIEQIVTQADAASVAQNLGADKEGINLAAEQARAVTFSLAGQLKLTLSHLLQSAEIPLNKKGAEGFVDGDHLYLMSKPIADRLRSTLLKYGNTSVPSDNSRLFNELQQHQLIRPNADDLAIWKCEVWLSEFDWRQTFTFICVHWPTLAPEAGLESLVGHIVPVSEDAAEAPSQVSSSQGEDTSRADAPPSETSNDNEEPHDNEALSDDLMAFAIAKAASQAAPETEEQNTLAHVGTQSAAPVDTVEAELEALKAASTAESSEPHTLLQKIDLRETQGEDLGHAFYEWLDSVLKGGGHPVNRQDALFHRLEQGLFVVSPGAFRTFIDERCQYAKTNSYSEVQQGLQPLNRHILTKDARNVHKVRIQDSNQALNGFLFPLTEEWETRYAVNPFVMLEGV